MARFAFCSGTFQSISPNINAELAMNVYPEVAASPNARSAIALLQKEGLALFGSLPAGSGQSILGITTFLGRTFTVGVVLASNSMHLYEVLMNKTLVDLGALGAPVSNAPAIWAANPNQLAFTVGGTGAIYVLGLKTAGTLAAGQIFTVKSSDLNGPAITVWYLQGFFVTALQNSNQIQVSNLEDGTMWLAINATQISDFADRIVAMAVNQLAVWFFGEKSTVPYYNSGALFPLAPIPGALIEEGAAAAYGIAKLDNTILFIGANVDQGIGIAYRMNGYTPQRISNHDVETAWQSYPTIADAISFAYQIRGHKFWETYFPTANATWRYDISTNHWHQLGTWNPQTSLFTAHKANCHTFNFGLHLVGDPFSGNIYSMSPANLTDNGAPIRRVRRAPYIAKEHENDFHRRLELLCETGLASAIAAPSDAPSTLWLADANGGVWGFGITDAGTVTAGVPAPAGQLPSTPILSDNVDQTTFWKLTSTLGGIIQPVNISYGRRDTAQYAMATNNTFMDTALQLNKSGVISVVPPQPHLREPVVEMRYSDDGGHTWSNVKTAGLGFTGDYRKRVIWRRLGKSRNRIYEIACSDPVSLRMVDAFINGPKDAQERGVEQMRKQA